MKSDILQTLVIEGIMDGNVFASKEIKVVHRTFLRLLSNPEEDILSIAAAGKKQRDVSHIFSSQLSFSTINFCNSPWYHIDWKPENDFSQNSYQYNAGLDSAIQRYLHIT